MAKFKIYFILFSMFISSVFSHESFENQVNYLSLFSDDRDLMVNVSFKKNPELINQLNQLGFDISGISHKEKLIQVVASRFEFEQLQKMNLSPKVEMSSLILKGVDEDYKTPEEIETILFQYEASYPDLARVEVIGKSVQGRNIYAIVLSRDVQTLSKNKPVILFNGMHHAREVMTPEVNLDIIDYLLKGSSNVNSDAFLWLSQNEIWVVPMINVDGNNKVWLQNNMWRKNVQGNFGVDINRNYPYGWSSCNGSSGMKMSDTYRGPSPGSEPETQAVMNLVKKIRPVFDISYHAFSELVIYPYGCKGKRTENKNVVETIGKEIGGLLNYKAGTSWETLYSVDGSDIDWMYNEFQVIPYVIEVNSRADGFQPSYAKSRQKTVELNRKGWQLLLNKLNQSGIRGKVNVAGSAINLEGAMIKILNQINQETYQYKLQANGLFHVVLNPGNYQIEIQVDNKTHRSYPIMVKDQLEKVDFTIN